MIKLNLTLKPLDAFIMGLNEHAKTDFTTETFDKLNPEVITEENGFNTQIRLVPKITDTKYDGDVVRRYIRVDITAAIGKLSKDGKLHLYYDDEPSKGDFVHELRLQTGIIIEEDDIKEINASNYTFKVDGLTLVGTGTFVKEPARIDLSTVLPGTVGFYQLTKQEYYKESKGDFITNLVNATRTESFTLNPNGLEFSEPSTVESTLNSVVTITVPDNHGQYKAGSVNVIYKRNPWWDAAIANGADEGDIIIYEDITDPKTEKQKMLDALNRDYDLNLTLDTTVFGYDETDTTIVNLSCDNYQFYSTQSKRCKIKVRRTHLEDIFPEENLNMFDPLEYITG